MSIDPRRRARQLARKAAKRKAQLAKKKKDTVGSWARASIAGWPIHECFIPGNLFQLGLGNVIISRKTGNQIATGIFLVDTGCLGVKSAALQITSASEFQDLLGRIQGRDDIVPVEAEYARKLIEGAVEYAAALGFKPHKDYFNAKVIFGAIDTALCVATFEFGRDGKPFYCSGPYESPEKRHQILDALKIRCGPDGFHFMTGIGDPVLDEDESDEVTDIFEV